MGWAQRRKDRVDRHRERLLAETREQLEIELSSSAVRGASPVSSDAEQDIPGSLAVQDSPASPAVQDFPDSPAVWGQARFYEDKPWGVATSLNPAKAMVALSLSLLAGTR